jgi:hypothetical protein
MAGKQARECVREGRQRSFQVGGRWFGQLWDFCSPEVAPVFLKKKFVFLVLGAKTWACGPKS